MIMGWFLAVGLLIGAAGTRTALRHGHTLKAIKADRGLLLLLGLAWAPLLCWLMAQWIDQW